MRALRRTSLPHLPGLETRPLRRPCVTHVREVNDLEALAALAPQWRRLALETPAASFFQTLDWLAVWWNHFGCDARLRVLVVGDGDGPSGIVPLVVRRRRARVGTIRVLTYPLDHWGSFFSPIGLQPARTLAAGLAHIRGSKRDWDLVELPWVDEHHVELVQEAFANAGLAAFSERRELCALVDLTEYRDWDAYWSSRTSRWRNNVRRSQKKLAEHGQVSHIRYRPAGSVAGDGLPRWDLYDECERVARASWQGSSRTGTTLNHDSIRSYLRDCHAAASAAGGADMNLLCVDGRAVAFNYAYRLAGHVFGLRTGFDPAAGEGAGSVLQAQMIEDSFARGDHTYDLGPGYLECKRYWLSETRWSHRVTHFAATPLAQLVRAKRSAGRWLTGPRPLSAGK